jgi:hypothetical protein
MWARIHLIPALQAEEDRDQVRRYLADKAREKELLGTETRVYNSDRYAWHCDSSHNDMKGFANRSFLASSAQLLRLRPSTQRSRGVVV